MINMNPGSIDWSKEDVVLMTPAGVQHRSYVTSRPASANCVTVKQGYDLGGYYIVDCGDYLSLRVFRSWDHCTYYRVTDFTGAVAKNAANLAPWCGSRYPINPDCVFESNREMRIYPDRKFAVVRRVTFADGDTLTYVSSDCHDLNRASRWGTTRASEISTAMLAATTPVIHEVFSDEDVAKYRQPMTKAIAKVIMSWCPDGYCDLTGKELRRPNFYWIGHPTAATQKAVEEFLGKDRPDSEHSRIWSEYTKKNHTENITSISDLLMFMGITGSVMAAAKSKQERAEELAKYVEEAWNHPDEHANEAIWFRKENQICLALPNSASGGYYWGGYGAGCKKIFAYDVKTKKRLYAEQDKRGNWSFPIPGLPYLQKACYLGRKHVYVRTDSGSRISKMVGTTTTILDGLTVEELFAGTNVGWILTNPHEKCVVKDDDDPDKRGVLANVDAFFRNDRIGTIAIMILATTGTPVLEQLLKANLFNMYFTILEDSISGYADARIADVDKKKVDRSYSQCIQYHGKQKNLKKMFNMPMTVLRYIDDACTWKTDTSYSSSYVRRSVPTLAGAERALGINSLGDLDADSLRKCMALASDTRQRNVWSNIGDVVVAATGGKCPPKQILSYIEEYRVAYNTIFADYLRMRTQLQTIEKTVPAAAGIWSEKRYPMKPGSARKFIAYVEGMPDRRYTGTTRPLDAKDFVAQLAYTYKEASKTPGKFVVVRDDLGRLCGVSIQMTPNEHLHFLHDEASYWVGFYHDAAKDGAFKEAVKRVQPLQWTDEKSGLMIVAPNCVNDIKEEGMTLSHCVASYVDPIISGKENIMFLRRTDMPEIPFYTVEILGDGEIRQVHCYANGSCTEEDQIRAGINSGLPSYNKTFDVVKFLQDWAKAMKGKVKASSITPYYRALCAIR